MSIEICKKNASRRDQQDLITGNQLVVGIINNIFEDHFGCNTINYFTTSEDQIVEQFYLARLIQFESFFSYKKWGNPY